MENIRYSDWYINQKSIPDKGSLEYEEFFDFHRKLCIEGVMMEDVFINPFLYWHLNFFNTDVSIEEGGRLIEKFTNPTLRDNEWLVLNEIWRANQERKGLMIFGIRRFSKDLLNTSKLYTPEGEIEIGSCKVGQKIFDDQGNLTKIIGVYPQGVRPVYKMTLGDGRVLYCGLDHNWEVIEKGSKKTKGKNKSHYRRVVKTTRELLKDYKRNRIHNGYKDGETHHVSETKYAIPNNEPVKYEEKNLPIDPYYLGLWLGDGASRSPIITTMDDEIKDFVYQYADTFNLKVTISRNKTDNKASNYSITSQLQGGNVKQKNPLRNLFHELNLFENKHIPKDYLYSSVEQRMALLQGLMDTDGYCATGGTIGFATSSERLRDDFYFLCRSLGIILNVKTHNTFYTYKGERKSGKPAFKFTLFTDKPIFRLSRKLANMRVGKKTYLPKITKSSIVDIQYVFDAPTTCIAVDNEQKLFLTDNFTVTHNTTTEASYITHGALFDENSQNVIAGLNSRDIKLITDKIDKALTLVPDAWRWEKIEDNWKNQVTLGVKTKDGKKYPFSYIMIRNLEDGNNEEAIAGTKPRKLIIDEAGKNSWLRAFQAAIPGFTTPYGWGCSPIVTGTGGDMKRFMDAKSAFFDCDTYNFIEYTDEKNPRRKHGLFISNKYRLEGKDESTLGKFLGKDESSDLHNVQMLVSNEEKAESVLESELAKRRKSGDRSSYLKEKMYYPKEVDDIFLNEDTNIFDADAARAQQSRISLREKTGTYIELFHDGEKITHKFSEKLPITTFPVKPNEDKDAPIVVWEMPIKDPPFGLYVAGCLLPGEKVMTDSGLMNVESVSFNNRLINKDGAYVDIVNLQRYYKEDADIYTIRVSNGFRGTTFTGEHPIYVSEHITESDRTVTDRRLDFSFVNARDVKIGQWIKVPNIYRSENNFDINILWSNEGHRIDRIVQSPLKNSEFWWFMGLFLGDGWVDKRGKIYISFNKSEHLHITRFKNLVNTLFNRSVSYRERGNCIEASFTCAQLNTFITDNFGKYARGKVIPEWVKRLPKQDKLSLISGYLDSDGCISKSNEYYNIYFVSINLELLEGIQDILFSLGYVSSLKRLRPKGTRYISDKIYITQETYQLTIGHNATLKFVSNFRRDSSHKFLKIDFDNIKSTVASPRKGCFLSDDEEYIYFKIKHIERSSYTGIVYNFECDTHTYMCRYITTHNCDPYRQGQAKDSDSLGAVYIYKRMHDIASEKFQDMFVASYVARPKKKEDWNEQARLLIKFYNARALCENDEISFIDYMISKGDGHYLEDQPQWLREIVPNTSVNREKGIHRSSQKIIDFLNGCLKTYLEEVISIKKDENGSVISETTGVARIFDKMLLEEIIQFNEDDNYDRIIASSLAIALAMKMNPILGKVKMDQDTRVQSLYKKPSKSTFSSQKPIFNLKK